MPIWEREPRPVLGAVVMAGALVLRVWAIPLFVVGWLVGAAAQAVAVGFMFAWEAIDWVAGENLRRGVRRRQRRGVRRRQQLEYEDDDDDDD